MSDPEYNVIRHLSVGCISGPVWIVAVGDHNSNGDRTWRAYMGVSPASFDTDMSCQWVARHGGSLRVDEAVGFFGRFGPEFAKENYR